MRTRADRRSLAPVGTQLPSRNCGKLPYSSVVSPHRLESSAELAPSGMPDTLERETNTRAAGVSL